MDELDGSGFGLFLADCSLAFELGKMLVYCDLGNAKRDCHLLQGRRE
jgi:hypothetical protein